MHSSAASAAFRFRAAWTVAIVWTDLWSATAVIVSLVLWALDPIGDRGLDSWAALVSISSVYIIVAVAAGLIAGMIFAGALMMYGAARGVKKGSPVGLPRFNFVATGSGVLTGLILLSQGGGTLGARLVLLLACGAMGLISGRVAEVVYRRSLSSGRDRLAELTSGQGE